MAKILVILRARFVGDDRRHLEHRAIVPRRGDANRLRKHGCQPRARNAVERFVPPVVLGHAEPRDRRRDVLHLHDLLFEGHS